MKTCKHCRWWRVAMEEAVPADYGSCMVDPPKVLYQYEGETGIASVLYERPQTYGHDFCSRFQAGTERKAQKRPAGRRTVTPTPEPKGDRSLQVTEASERTSQEFADGLLRKIEEGDGTDN